MSLPATERPVLLIKKLGAVLLLIVGLFLTAVGFSNGPTWLGVLGVILLAGGALLLVLKIVRRNQS